MELKIAVLPGDGIGPEISRVGVEVMKAVGEKFGHPLEFAYAIAGAGAIDTVGDPFPDDTLTLCRRCDAVLFSAVGDPKYDNDPAAPVRPEQGLLKMRKELGLYANIRPVETYRELLDRSPLRRDVAEGADFVCVRELTGGMYFGRRQEGEDYAFDTCEYSRHEVERVLHVAYRLAESRRRHVTVVDKANILASSRLWRRVAQEVAGEYPAVATDYLFVDNAAMRLIEEPRAFDVIVTENTFGDILTDEASVVCGSMGLLASASVGEGTPVFEPVHGSWPQAAGRDIANPLAQVLSAAMLFEHFGLRAEGLCIRRAVAASLAAGVGTPDLFPDARMGTRAVGRWLVEHILTA